MFKLKGSVETPDEKEGVLKVALQIAFLLAVSLIMYTLMMFAGIALMSVTLDAIVST